MLNTVLLIEAKKESAEIVVQKWCDRYEHARAEIPVLIERGSGHSPVGRLVYALRTYIDLDPISCGELLDVHPSYVSRLQCKMRCAIQARKQENVRDATEEFLAECKLIERRFVQRDVQVTRRQTTRSNGRKGTSGRRRASTYQRLIKLESEGSHYIDKILWALGNPSYGDVFGPKKRRDLFEARCIAYGVLYHVVLGSQSQGAVGLFCKTTQTTVYEGLRSLHEAIILGIPPEFREKVSRVCSAINISPNDLLPA